MEINSAANAPQAPIDTIPGMGDIYTPFDPIFDADVITPQASEAALDEMQEDGSDSSSDQSSALQDLNQDVETEAPVYDGGEAPIPGVDHIEAPDESTMEE